MISMALQGRGNAINVVVVLASVLLATLLLQTGRAEAKKNHHVGDLQNWGYPAIADLGYYDKWSAQQTFLPGDTLTFSYDAAEHDTTLVTATQYAGCVYSTGKKYTSGTDVVTLPAAGTYYFYCGVMGHCEMGMKMKVVVAGAAVTPVTPPVVAPAPVPVVAPAPSPVPVLSPVPVPAPSPIVLAPAPGATAPTPVIDTPVISNGPAAAPAQVASSAGSLSTMGLHFLAALAVAAVGGFHGLN